ncbi:hypothetical protein JI57_02975 [Psychromonas sp. PRT-SC03]|nr:hypothetical protein JI57_02975 [Psychromonas sp. PRT-SC03]
MKKIALCCAAGMSTSMLVKKMRDSATTRGIDISIDAFPIAEFKHVIEANDCVLLAPQVCFKLDDFAALAAPLNKKVALISFLDYGTMNGANVLDLGLQLISE